MKKILVFLVLLFFGGLSYYAYTIYSNGGLQKPRFVKLENVKFSGIELPPDLSCTFSADMLLHNPNPLGISLADMDFDVFVNDQKTTHVTQSKKVLLDPNSDFSVPLSFKIPLSEIVKNQDMLKIISGAWKEQSIKIRNTGKIYFSIAGQKIAIPFDQEDDYFLKDYF